MALAQRIADDLKTSLRSGDQRRRSVIRLLLAAMKNAEIEKNGPLTLEEASGVLKKAGISGSAAALPRLLEASWAMRRGEPLPAGVDENAVRALAKAGDEKAAAAGPLTDSEVMDLVRKQAKQRRDSAEAYRKAGREDLAASEEAELAVLEEYLPQPLTDDELRALVREAIAEVGASSMRDLGKVMPTAIARADGRADGRRISAVARELLQ